MEKQNKKNIQIDRSLFADICLYFDLLDNSYIDKKELEINIKNGLQEKIKAIQKRFAYEDMIKAKGTEDYENALLKYLELK